MKQLIKKYWYLSVFIIMFVTIVLVIPLTMPVSAKEVEVPDCVPIAKTVDMKIYRCSDDDNGFTFYINSLGFMFSEP